MRKITFFLIAAISILLLTDYSSAEIAPQNNSINQEVPSLKSGNRKTLRKYRRAQNNALQSIAIEKLVESKNFIYYPSQLQYAAGQMYQNVQLSSYYYIEVTPTQLTVLLPIFGANRYSGQPSFWKELNFFTSNFTYDVTQSKDGLWRVTIKAMDTWSFNTFTFEFQVARSGATQLSISTMWEGPAYFSGSMYSN